MTVTPGGSDREALMLACPACRSQQRHEPGTKSLACTACGARTAILERTGATLVEQPYDDWVHSNAGRQVASLGGVVMRCEGCHATTEMAELASVCQFCRGHLVQVTSPDGVVPPSGVLPFLLDRRQATDAFTAWVTSHRLGIDELTTINAAESFTSTYLPVWSFSATATTTYEGRRGDRKPVRLPDDRVEMHTEWQDAAGTVTTRIDSQVVEGRKVSVVQDRLVRNLSLEGTVPFQPEYLAGHTATRYDRDPASAFEEVRRAAEKKRIPKDVRDHIGGDRTEVRSALTGYSDVRFALILAPLWVLTYIAAGKTWQVLVDGRTGEVAGEFPVDGGKLARLLLTWLGKLALVVVGFVAIVYFFNR